MVALNTQKIDKNHGVLCQKDEISAIPPRKILNQSNELTYPLLYNRRKKTEYKEKIHSGQVTFGRPKVTI